VFTGAIIQPLIKTLSDYSHPRGERWQLLAAAKPCSTPLWHGAGQEANIALPNGLCRGNARRPNIITFTEI